MTATPRSASTTAALTPGDAAADDDGLGARRDAADGRAGSAATSDAGACAAARRGEVREGGAEHASRA